jgi:hypothetical protein
LASEATKQKENMLRILSIDRRLWFLPLMILTMLLELSGPAVGQQFGFPGRGRRHGGSETQDRLEYNPQTVTTVQGQVEDLGSYGMTGWRVAPGMTIQGLVLKTSKGNLTINLGPSWYMRKQGFTLLKGDNLEVTGSKVTKDEKTVLLAAEVKKNDQTLKVRDEKGVPLWRGQGPDGQGTEGRRRGGMGAGGRGRGSW